MRRSSRERAPSAPARALEGGLRALGVSPGGCLLVHSDVSTLLQAGLSPGGILDALTGVLGREGTLVLPTFNFDWCGGAGFDHRRTRSQMGIITEIARRGASFVRTSHPVYSFAVSGPLAGEFLRYDNPSGYGVGSGFDVLRKLGGSILVIGLPWGRAMTFLHHVEEHERVPYRYFKSFRGVYRGADGGTTEREYFLYVRDLDAGVETYLDDAEEHSVRIGLAREARVLGARMTLTEANALFEETRRVLRQNPGFLHRVVRKRSEDDGNPPAQRLAPRT